MYDTEIKSPATVFRPEPLTMSHDEEHRRLEDVKLDEESTMPRPQEQAGQDLQTLVADLHEKMRTLETKLKRYEDQGLRKRSSSMAKPFYETPPMFTNMMELDQTKEEEDDVDEVRAFPHSTVSFLLVTRWPLCGRSPPQDAIDCSQQGRVFRAKHRSRDYLCLPFWFSSGIVALQAGVYTLAL